MNLALATWARGVIKLSLIPRSGAITKTMTLTVFLYRGYNYCRSE